MSAPKKPGRTRRQNPLRGLVPLPGRDGPPSTSSSPASLPLPAGADGQNLPIPDERYECGRCGTKHHRDREHCPTCGLEVPPAWMKGYTKAECKQKHIFPPNSPIRQKVMLILAMRFSGMSDEEIAPQLNLSPRTVKDYIKIAGVNGWLDLPDQKEKLEYQVIPKAVRNLDAMLDSPDSDVKHNATLKTLEGTLFKQFGVAQGGPQLPGVLAIKIEMPPGALAAPRPEALGGVPAYVEGDAFVVPEGS